MKTQRASRPVWFWIQMLIFVPIAPGFFCMQTLKEWIRRLWPDSRAAKLAAVLLAPIIGGTVGGIFILAIFVGIRALIRAI
jgi:hypothetical protein